MDILYILLSAIASFLIGMYLEANLSAQGYETQIPTMVTIVVMGCFILYDNKRRHK